MGDMAVSNSIGSNIFDVLLGLGFPWALRTLIVSYGSVVRSKCSLIDRTSSNILVVSKHMITYLRLGSVPLLDNQNNRLSHRGMLNEC